MHKTVGLTFFIYVSEAECIQQKFVLTKEKKCPRLMYGTYLFISKSILSYEPSTNKKSRAA